MAVSGRAHAPANADPMAGVDVAANGTAWRDAAVDVVVWAVREEDVGAETGALECDALRAFDAASGGRCER